MSLQHATHCATPLKVAKGLETEMSPMQTAKSANPQTAMSAAEKAAKKELNLAKLKLEMAAAKLRYVRAVEAYEAAKSGEDAAQYGSQVRGNPTVVLDGLRRPTQRQRSPSYWRRLKRRTLERMAAEEAAAVAKVDADAATEVATKKIAVETAVAEAKDVNEKQVKVAQAEAEAAKQEVVTAEVEKEVAVAKGKQDAEVAIKQAAAEVQKVAVDAADDTKAKTEAAAVFCDGCYRRQDASKKLSRVYGLVFCDKCSFAQLYEK
jgi:hypothetical protein